VIPVVIISMSRSLDRREAMMASFHALGVPFTFFDAVDGQTMTDEEVAVLSPKPYVGHKKRPLNRGEIGCAESFRRVLQKFVAGGDDYLCVAEDDANFSPQALAYLDPATLEGLEPFDVLRLAGDPQRDRGLTRVVASGGGRAVHAPLRVGFFTLAQVVSRVGAQKVLNGLVPLWAPIDVLIYRDTGIVGLRVLEVRPAVVLRPDAPSTIPGRFQQRTGGHASLDVELRRKLWLLTRRFRAVWSYLRAWGFIGLVKLRPNQARGRPAG
jgi:glycosyl transferase, family 25